MASIPPLWEAGGGGSHLQVALVRLAVGVVSPLLLVSMGGAGIYSAPVLFPVLWWTAHRSEGGLRWYFTVVAGLAAAETAWAISWSFFPSFQSLLPIAAASAMVTSLVTTSLSYVPRRVLAIFLIVLAGFGACGVLAVAEEGGQPERQVSAEPTISAP